MPRHANLSSNFFVQVLCNIWNQMIGSSSIAPPNFRWFMTWTHTALLGPVASCCIAPSTDVWPFFKTRVECFSLILCWCTVEECIYKSEVMEAVAGMVTIFKCKRITWFGCSHNIQVESEVPTAARTAAGAGDEYTADQSTPWKNECNLISENDGRAWGSELCWRTKRIVSEGGLAGHTETLAGNVQAFYRSIRVL